MGEAYRSLMATPSPLALRVIPLPRKGVVLADARGADRMLRVSWHGEVGLLVLSLWRDDECVGSFRLETQAVPALVDALVTGLAEAAVAAAQPG